MRAYRTVNGKKVYGYFSAPKEYVPDWTIDEIYEELWKYGESLAWTEYEWKEGIENPETGDELWPTNRKYHFKHCSFLLKISFIVKFFRWHAEITHFYFNDAGVKSPAIAP